MKRIALPGGETVPALGQGTWMMGEDPSCRRAEIDALSTGIDLGMTLIDTAEMYGEGASERLIGEAIDGRRDEIFLVSKAYPHNASRTRLPQACAASLRRLGTDRLDLYLLHWRGGVPLAETVEAMEALREAGRIRHWGVSNLDTADLDDLIAAGGAGCVTDQILYNVGRRGPEYDLLPWLIERRMVAMAYSPIEQGMLLSDPTLAAIARARGVTPAQIALAWTMRGDGVIAIPKASSADHVRDNRRAADLALSDAELAAIDEAFPPPVRPTPLAML